MRWTTIVLICVMTACSEEEPPAEEALTEEEWPEALDEEDLIVRWYARDHWGFERFEVFRDGRTRYELARERMPTLRVQRTMDGPELEALRDRFREQDCCALESDPGTAFAYQPSEGLLQVRLPGVDCNVRRMLYRWDDEETVQCDYALRQVHGRNRPHGTVPEGAEERPEDSAAEASSEEEPADGEEPDEAVGDVPPG